jgi:hypothetical protein
MVSSSPYPVKCLREIDKSVCFIVDADLLGSNNFCSYRKARINREHGHAGRGPCSHSNAAALGALCAVSSMSSFAAFWRSRY